MGSTGEERSLASGIPIPQWMRNKTDHYGFDPSALSPPMHEGEFFYVKFPRPQQQEKNNSKTLSEVLGVKEKAFLKHTESCKQFIPKIQDTVQIPKPKITKPRGVDDGFKGEEAACGSSVVEVAHQMLTGKSKSFKPLLRGETEGSIPPPPSYLQNRRDSKSLPASPTASPESSPLTKRKNNPNFQNRGIFAGNFHINPDNLSESEENLDKKNGSSWILSSLFAAKEKKDGREQGNEKGLVAAVASDSQNLINYMNNNSPEQGKEKPVNVAVEIKAISPPPDSETKKSIFKSKPYLRDLNLLTPSSM